MKHKSDCLFREAHHLFTETLRVFHLLPSLSGHKSNMFEKDIKGTRAAEDGHSLVAGHIFAKKTKKDTIRTHPNGDCISGDHLFAPRISHSPRCKRTQQGLLCVLLKVRLRMRTQKGHTYTQMVECLNYRILVVSLYFLWPEI